MTIDHEELARELEAKFADRFTDKDECYVRELNSRPVSPPCVYPYFNHQNRGRGRNNQSYRQDNRGSYSHSNSPYNNSYNNYQRSNQYGQHPGGQPNQGYHHDSDRPQGNKKRRYED